jgi:hypothetical protein
MKEKLDRAKERAKTLAKKIASGTKGTIIAAGTGVASAWVLPMAADKIDALNDDKNENAAYYKGGALIVAGHLVKKKQYDAGTGLAAIGGYIIGEHLHKKSEEDSSSTSSGAATDMKTAGALMDVDAGWTMLESRPDAGAVSSAPDAGAQIQSAPQPNQLSQGMRKPLPAVSRVGEAAALYS